MQYAVHCSKVLGLHFVDAFTTADVPCLSAVILLAAISADNVAGSSCSISKPELTEAKCENEPNARLTRSLWAQGLSLRPRKEQSKYEQIPHVLSSARRQHASHEPGPP